MSNKIRLGDRFEYKCGIFVCRDRGSGVIRGVTANPDRGKREDLVECPEEACVLITPHPPRFKNKRDDEDDFSSDDRW